MALTDFPFQVAPDSTSGESIRSVITDIDSVLAAQPVFGVSGRSVYDAVERSAASADFWLGVLGHIVETILIVLVAWTIVFAVSRTLRRWMRSVQDLPIIDPHRQRAMTIGSLLMSTTRYVVWPLAIITIISEFGVNVAALIATAGFAGLAVGFGAQTVVRDVMSGFFLLFDDTIHVGDTITFNGMEGVVEHLGVRLIRMRRFDGELVMIPAGELRVFGNHTAEYMRAIVEVGVSYEQDTEAAIEALGTIAREWADANRAILLDEKPEVHAIQALGDSAVTMRVAIRVVPGEQWEAKRSLRRLIKQRFDEQSIEIPFPRRTIYVRREPGAPDDTDVLQAGA